MTPEKVVIGNAELWWGDCREVLPLLAQVDAVITDPPYTDRTHGMAKSNAGKGHGTKAIDFESLSAADLRSTLEVCGQLTKRWVVATLDYAHAFSLDEYPPDGLRMLRIGVWVKSNPMPQISADRPGQGWEAIAFMHRADRKPYWNGGGRAGVWRHPVVQNTGHPTSKPLPLVSDLVTLFTDYGDTVCDPFMGGGTTGEACAATGRKFIGVERERKYFDLACSRIATAQAQGQMFAPEPPKAEQINLLEGA